MAKTKKINADIDIDITPKTKSSTWEYTASSPVVVNFKPKSNDEYTNGYKPIFYRKGNNLVYTVNFYKPDSSYKTITTTIKNYFTSSGAGDIQVNGTVKNLNTELYSYQTSKNITNTIANDKIIGNNKNNSYNIINLGGDEFVDLKGNDKYTINASYEAGKIKKVYDYSGNDKYYANAGAFFSTYDLKGNDKYYINGGRGEFDDKKGKDSYDITNNSGTVTIRDRKGDDKYKLHGSNNTIVVNDYTGKDKYTVTNTGHSQVREEAKSNDTYKYKNIVMASNGNCIDDYGGKDKYTFENVTGATDKKFGISEYGGKDKYTLKSGTSYVNITDNYKITHSYEPTEYVGSGDDTYSFSNVSNIKVEDYGGKNKFTSKNSNDIDITTYQVEANKIDKSSKDSYNISGIAPTKKNHKTTAYAHNIAIADKGATSNDTYKLSYIEKTDTYDIAHAWDWGGSDTYTLDHTIGFVVRDCENNNSASKNKYNVSYSKDFKIYTSCNNNNVIESGNLKTNDTYNIKASTGEVWDYQGSDDKYNISKLNGYIKMYENQGTDTLKFSDAKAKDLVFMSDFGYASSSALYIYDKKNKGFIRIDNFFTTESDGNGNFNHTGYGYGKVETITAGKSKTNLVNSINLTQLDSVKSEVASWMQSNYGHGNISFAIQDSIDGSKDISQLIAYFDKK